mmetsp:Transcript_115463/g.326355  ORF Transcript_115463/g.326355 Transcript_115463/m.326355 type:complete len:325 (-) Transcript_115463:46-1020(-)
MGRQVLYLTCGITVGSVLLMFAAVCQPLHAKAWAPFAVETSALWMYVPPLSCKNHSNFTLLPDSTLCDMIGGFHTLGTARSIFCSPQFFEYKVREPACTAVSSAWLYGGVIVFVCLVNCVQKGYCLYILYVFSRRPRTHLRRCARLLLATTAIISSCSLLAYITALTNLDDFFHNVQALGHHEILSGRGYLLLWFEVIVDCIACGLCSCSKLREEARLAEMKAHKNLEQEMAKQAFGWGAHFSEGIHMSSRPFSGPSGGYPNLQPGLSQNQAYPSGFNKQTYPQTGYAHQAQSHRNAFSVGFPAQQGAPAGFTTMNVSTLPPAW